MGTRARRKWVGRLLAAVAVAIAATSLGLATPAAAGPIPPCCGVPVEIGHCAAYADLPWHSSVTNRVYFSGHTRCDNDRPPDLVTLFTEWYRDGHYLGENVRKCYDSFACYTGAGSYIIYPGPGYYCTVIEAYIVYYGFQGYPVNGVKNCRYL